MVPRRPFDTSFEDPEKIAERFLGYENGSEQNQTRFWQTSISYSTSVGIEDKVAGICYESCPQGQDDICCVTDSGPRRCRKVFTANCLTARNF